MDEDIYMKKVQEIDPTDTSDDVGLVPLGENEVKLGKRDVYKTLAALSVTWVFTFTAYSGLQNLESSLNPTVGVYSLAALTGGGVISCILAPAVLGYIGNKLGLVLSWICLCIFIAANYYPKSYILIPAAGIEGLSTGLMWTAQGCITTIIAGQYSQMVGEAFDAVLSRFFGIFCMAFQSTQIWGNLISSLVLHEGAKSVPSNHTSALCGHKVCPGPGAPIKALPEGTVVYTLISVYMGLTVIGMLVTIIFLKPIKSTPAASSSPASLLVSTLKLLGTHLNMAFLVPLSLYTGLEQVVLYAEYTRAFIACELGLGWIGYVLMSFGLINTISSPLVGIITKFTGRPAIFGLAFLLNLGSLAGLRFWQPNANELYYFFIFPSVWGLADAIWQTQSATLVGVAFPDRQEPAFANLRMFQALGFTIGYLYSNHLCESIKLYIVAAELTLSVILVSIVEFRIRKSSTEVSKVM